MNHFDEKSSEPNYWLSCMIIDKDAMCKQNRTDKEVTYIPEAGRSCPSEILETLLKYNAEGRPIWKPMHMQPIYEGHDFVCANGKAVDEDIFERGLCLPSDNKMTIEEQDLVIELIHRCFE